MHGSIVPRPAARWTEQPIISEVKWAPTLWSVRTSKPDGFRFQPGHYARLGLVSKDAEETIWRPYSIVSSPTEPFLEYLITLVPGGAFTSRLLAQQSLFVESAVMGFFLPSQFAAGESLWLLATGAGLGPYISLLREEKVFGEYRNIVLVHSVRLGAELAYREELQSLATSHNAFKYIPIVTREAGFSSYSQRMPALIDSGALESAAGVHFAPESARVMVCGNPAFTTDMRQVLTTRKFEPCRRGFVGSMLFEKYWNSE